MTALYLYGFADGDAGPCLGRLSDQSALRMDERHPIALIRIGSIMAVTCAVDAADYANEGRQPEGWLAERACRHAALLSALLEEGAVLPVKFGALFSSRHELDAMVSIHAGTIADALQGLRGRAEWGIKAFVDPSQASAMLLKSDPELRMKNRALAHSSPGARYLHARQLENRLAEALRTSMREFAGQIANCLSVMAEAHISLPLVSPASDGNVMACHEAVLLPRQLDSALLSALEAVMARWRDGGWRIELSGPWPAYHFCPPLPDATQATC